MFAATITITDITQPGRSLYHLLTTGSGAGYTVAPSDGINEEISMVGGVSYLSIQASYGNGQTIIYKGDERVANDGSRQAKEMAAGDTDVSQAYPNSVNLREIYVRASVNGGKFNVECHYS